MKPSILIIGITGGSGLAFANACETKGWPLKALHRDPERVKSSFTHLPNIEWIKGDAMNANDVANAANGVDIIFHGANPPGYTNWRKLAMPMLENSILAAIHQKARLVLPGNVYNFSPDAMPLISENSPQNPISRKGQIRVEMEQMLKQATEKGAKALIVRAGDFFGPNAPGSWLGNAIVKPGKKIKSVTYPGDHSVGHNWAYLPDLADTMVALLEREDELDDFEVFNFGGHYFPHGVSFAEEVLKAAGVESGSIKKLPWLFLKIASPFVTLFRELLEMRYLWQMDLQLDNSKLLKFLKTEPHTPIEQALEETLKSLKCL